MTVPVEVVRAAELERDEVMEVFMHVSDEWLLVAIRMVLGNKFYPPHTHNDERRLASLARD